MKILMRDRLLWGLAIGGDFARAYQTDKLFLWTPPGYSRKKYRGLVARMVREGYVQQVLVEGRPNFRLTGTGRKHLMMLKPVLKQVDQAWDGFWRVLIFDVAEKQRRLRDLLRRQLIKMDFGCLQNSTYISPYDYSKEFLSYLDLKALGSRVYLLESKQKYLGEAKKLAEKVWGIEAIANRYNQVIDRLVTRFGIKESVKREEFLKKVYRDYLETLILDPMLPPDLLPADWPIEKAKKYLLRAGVVKE